MSYPEKGNLNLQQVVRDLEKRIEALEGKHLAIVEEPSNAEPPAEGESAHADTQQN